MKDKIKVYRGHATAFCLTLHKLDFPDGANNPSDQEVILNMIADLSPFLSPAAWEKLIKMGLDGIKEQDKKYPGPDFFNSTAKELKAYIKSIK